MSKQKKEAEKDRLADTVPASEATSLVNSKERGGPKGPEPTRFGDWENNGRCTDF